MFQHYIISQFNVKWKWREGHWATKAPPDSKWFDYRLKIFKKYTYPSIVNQTNQNFKWLVFFDNDATDRMTIKNLPRITPIFMKNYKLWSHKDVVRSIMADLKPADKFVITSTLDIDDMYHPKMIGDVQKLFISEPTIIDFRLGLFHNISNGKLRLYEFDKYLSPFFSMIEPVDKRRLMTCKIMDHAGVKRKFRNRFNFQQYKYSEPFKPMWVTNIHAKNTVLRMRGKKLHGKTLNNYGIKCQNSNIL